MAGCRIPAFACCAAMGFWPALMSHDVINASYLNSQDNSAVRGDPTRSFVWGGIAWEWYSGTSSCKIADDEAYAIPEGVPGMFLTRYAPAPYQETVNTTGLPYYAKSEMMKFNKGLSLRCRAIRSTSARSRARSSS